MELYNQIRVQNREEYFLNDIDSKAKEIRDRGYQFGFRSEMALEFSRMLIMYSHDIFRAMGILMVLLGLLTIGKMLAIFAYAWIIMRPVDKLMNFMHLYFNAKTSIERLNEIFLLHLEPKYQEKVDPFKDRETASIRIENLSFSYDNKINILKTSI